MQPLLSRTFDFVELSMFIVQVDSTHVIFPQITMFVRILLRICSYDNECVGWW